MLCAAQSRQRRPRIASGESRRALGMRDDRVEHRALVALREIAELEAGRAGFLDLSCDEGDLDVGRQERRSFQRLRDFRVRADSLIREYFRTRYGSAGWGGSGRQRNSDRHCHQW